MAFATVNGLPVADCRLCLPRTGMWVARVGLDTEDDVGGAVVLTLGEVQFEGTVRRSGTSPSGLRLLQVVAGAAGFGTEVAPKGYNDVPLRVPLADILATAGEVLAGNAEADILNTQLQFWATLRGPAGDALAHLLDLVPDSSWRMLFDGTLWVGREGWPRIELEHELISEDPTQNKVTISAEDPVLTPGSTFMDRRVAYIEHVLSADEFLTTVRFE